MTISPRTIYRLAITMGALAVAAFSSTAVPTARAQNADMMIRISEIEIEPRYLDAYRRILQEEADASLRLEPGVLCIFPSFQKDDPTQVRILEIYADRAAYAAHIKSPNFQKYKTTTLEMVKSLKLVDMNAIDAIAMPLIFKKMNSHH